jgi:lipopolysaccharide biosynthesis regulator YciM
VLDTLFAWLLFPLGGLLGWALARRRSPAEKAQGIHADTLAGLGSLARNDDDQAISALSRAVEAEPGTVELQAALGGLFRKRGEIDRAIRLHESVLARTDLSPADADSARYELAQDFLKAGLMDRAEPLLQRLAEQGSHAVSALELLLDLYEQGRDWRQAIGVAQRLQSLQGRSMSERIAHYHCELAENARHGGDPAEAGREAQRALDVDRSCTRANFLLASMAEAGRDWSVAIRHWWRGAEQDPRYIAEAVGPIERCYREAGNPQGYSQLLADAEVQFPQSGVIARARAKQLRDEGKDAQEYLATLIGREPSAQSLLLWLQGTSSLAEAGGAQLICETLGKRLAAKPRYSCRACGLEPSVLFWQCPSCKTWGSVIPAVEGL